MDLIKTALAGMPGIVQSVKKLKESGYILGIGTSLTKEYVGIVLNRLTLSGYFEVIVTGDEIKNGKPHPDTFLITAQKLGFKPEECIVIEDATSGIQSAKAAGCICIAIENPHAVPQDTSIADAVISSHDEITDELIKKLSAN